MSKPALLISACLLGEPCRYDGKRIPMPKNIITELNKEYRLVPICPEMLGGLPTPRIPAERSGKLMIRRDGADVTESFVLGAEKALEAAQKNGCGLALLKERSPSCGKTVIYDGSFSGKTVAGMGVTAELLVKAGICVFCENETDRLIKSE